ncbi:glycosyltransferase [Photobacterium damselae]|uniref:glycosyltransferase n=1 Tax=Photobacterium damselae TaxID=38293 RepID=UPI0030F409DF
MKVLNIYSGNANAQTGIGTVLHTLNNDYWNKNNIEYDTLSLDNISDNVSKENKKKSTKKILLSKGRLIWWQLAEKNIFFSISYIRVLYLNRAKKLVINNIETIKSSDVILVNDLWTILILFEYYPELLSKCCYINHSDGELAGFIKKIFNPIDGSKFFNDINNKLTSALSLINHLVVLSEVAKSRVMEQYSFLCIDDITVIYNGFKESKVKENYIDTDSIKLHVAGTLCSRKRQYLLIPIMKKLQEENVELNIYGNGPDFDFLNKKIQVENLNKIIKLKGYKNAPYKDYSFGDIFILLSEKEGFPMAAVEATSVGCSLILTNAGGAKELIDKTSGFLIDSNDNDIIINEVVNIIHKILKQKDNRFNLAYNAINGYKNNFTDEIMTNCYINLSRSIYKNDKKQKL